MCGRLTGALLAPAPRSGTRASVRHHELDHVPARRVLVARLAADRVDDLALVPADDLRGPLSHLVRHRPSSAERLDRDDRQVHRLGGVHLIRDPVSVLDIEGAQDHDRLGVLDLVTELLPERFLAAGHGRPVRVADVDVEEIGRGFHVLEDTTVIVVPGKSVRHEDADGILFRHRPRPVPDPAPNVLPGPGICNEPGGEPGPISRAASRIAGWIELPSAFGKLAACACFSTTSVTVWGSGSRFTGRCPAWAT